MEPFKGSRRNSILKTFKSETEDLKVLRDKQRNLQTEKNTLSKDSIRK